MVVNPVHPVVGKTPGQESVMPVVPTCHHQNGKGTDVHTAPHLNQICQHRGTDVIGIGTAPHQLRRHPHIRLPQVARLHPATDTTIKGEGITADGDDDTVLVQPASHPSLVPPPLSGHLQNRIKRGKYVNFDKLLLPPHTPPLSMFNQKSAKKRNTEKRQVVDLNSWLEAWNRYATCRIASDPAMALELVKYQTVVSLLFARYPAASVIEYDCLFRQQPLVIAQCAGTLQRKKFMCGP